MSNLAPGLKPSSLDLLDVASIGVDGVASWLENVVEKCEENDGSELSSVAAAFVIFLKNCGVSLSVSVDGNDAPCGESVAAVEVSANDLPSGVQTPFLLPVWQWKKMWTCKRILSLTPMLMCVLHR